MCSQFGTFEFYKNYTMLQNKIHPANDSTGCALCGVELRNIIFFFFCISRILQTCFRICFFFSFFFDLVQKFIDNTIIAEPLSKLKISLESN